MGADPDGKYLYYLHDDSIRNQATIADNVGDNEGDVAGIKADLFGCFAESTCAALLIKITFLENLSNLMYPLIISGVGMIAIFLASFAATNYVKIHNLH